MTGMKEGAGEDPFADAGDDETAGDAGDAAGDGDGTDGADGADTAADATPTEATDGAAGTQGQVQIPYRFRRDGVQDGRDRVPLFLQADTKRAEREALRELEARFDDDVALTDLREAVVKAGLAHLDDVAGHLEGWGYGLSFEE